MSDVIYFVFNIFVTETSCYSVLYADIVQKDA